MDKIVTLQIGKKAVTMRFRTYAEGAALLAIDDAVQAPQPTRVFAWNRRTGEITRFHTHQENLP